MSHQVQSARECLQAVNNQAPRHRGTVEEIRGSGGHNDANIRPYASDTVAEKSQSPLGNGHCQAKETVLSAWSHRPPSPSAVPHRTTFKIFPYTHDFMPLNEKSDLAGSGQGSFVTLPCSRTEKESPPTAPLGLEMLHINNAHCKGGEGNP